MNSRKPSKTGAIQAAAVGALAIGTLVFVAVSSIPRNMHPRATATKTDEHALPASNYLDIVGVPADALTAVGLTPEQAGTVFANLQTYLDGDGAALQNTIDSWGLAYRAADMARRDVRSGKGTVEAMQTADSTLATAAAAKTSAINAAFTAAVSELDADTAAALVRIRTNRPQNVPVQYLLVDRTEAQWRALYDSLVHKRQRDAASRAADSSVTQLLSDVNAESVVSTAATRVTQNLESIRQAMH